MTRGSRMAQRFLPIVGANAREAVDSLLKARMRTVLGLVGIMIGISSVIAMVSLGEIAREQARSQFETLGTDILLVQREDGGGEIGLTDAMGLADATPSIVEAAPRIRGYGTFGFAGREVGQGTIQGVTHSFSSVNRRSMAEGRFVSDLDTDRYYCVIGAEIAQTIRDEGTADQLLGELFDVGGILFTIVGVLAPKGESYALPMLLEANRSVFIPITTSRRIADDPGVEVIVARSGAGVHYETTVEDVRSYFRKRSPNLALDIVTAKELIAQMEDQMGIFTLLLGAVGSISLIVGGIGIMNIMLVSVAERRVEIAIRRALGARQRDIRSQFLMESAMLTMAGGMLGIALGLAATWGICRFTGWQFLVSGVSVASGLGMAATIGIFFGFQPAHQASRLDPIEGLQGR